MRTRLVWSLGRALILALSVMSASCSIIEKPVPPLPVATIEPPVIPHSIDGLDDCRACHANGVIDAPRFPDDHSQRPSDVCLTCHVRVLADNEVVSLPTMPIPPAATTPTEISAKEIYDTKCAFCHGVNREGVPSLGPALTAESLAGLTDSDIEHVISDEREGTTMQAYKGTLSQEELEALIPLIMSPIP